MEYIHTHTHTLDPQTEVKSEQQSNSSSIVTATASASNYSPLGEFEEVKISLTKGQKGFGFKIRKDPPAERSIIMH